MAWSGRSRGTNGRRWSATSPARGWPPRWGSSRVGGSFAGTAGRCSRPPSSSRRRITGRSRCSWPPRCARVNERGATPRLGARETARLVERKRAITARRRISPSSYRCSPSRSRCRRGGPAARSTRVRRISRSRVRRGWRTSTRRRDTSRSKGRRRTSVHSAVSPRGSRTSSTPS